MKIFVRKWLALSVSHEGRDLSFSEDRPTQQQTERRHATKYAIEPHHHHRRRPTCVCVCHSKNGAQSTRWDTTHPQVAFFFFEYKRLLIGERKEQTIERWEEGKICLFFYLLNSKRQLISSSSLPLYHNLLRISPAHQSFWHRNIFHLKRATAKYTSLCCCCCCIRRHLYFPVPTSRKKNISK